MRGYAVGITSMLTENSRGIDVSGEPMRNVNCYLYYDYLHISSNGEKSGTWMLESGWGRGERKSYTNKYKWKVFALFLKGLAGNAGTL